MEISIPEYSRDKDRGQVGIETLIVFIAMILVAAIAASVLINTAGFLQNQASQTSQDSEDQVSNQVLIISSIGDITEAEVEDGWDDEVDIGLNWDNTGPTHELTFDSDAEEFGGTLWISSDHPEISNVSWEIENDSGDLTFDLGDDELNDEEYTIFVSFGENVVELESDDSDSGDSSTDLTIEEANMIGDISMTVMQSPGADEIDLEGASVEYIGPDGQETLIYDDVSDAEAGTFEVTTVRDDGETNPVLTTREDRLSIDINLAMQQNEDLRTLHEGEDATIRITTQAGSEAVTILNAPQSLSSYDDGDAVEL